ncbi:energy transducer TonB [Edaphobacter bradus]|uniref:energy transducer TonB n=1 Tax=Edaphobacter bradus TaxID=2259016 RepID=UPI0021E054C6|nr:energy transducer TonB [Edaphobacter bradus]
MRRFLAAALALSPALLHAQANSPAQPQTSATVLESKLTAPAEITGAAETAATAPVRVTTGVTAPRLIHTVAISSSSESLAFRSGIDRQAVVSLLVDEKGVPSNPKIVLSAGADIDNNVLEAVKQYRFQPGSLNHHPTAVPVNLHITIQNGLQ